MSKPFNPVFSGLPTTIFETMSRLAREHNAVNLGQGFPDDPGAEDIRAKAAEAVVSGWNQYPPMMGLPERRLRERWGDPGAIAGDVGREERGRAAFLELLGAVFGHFNEQNKLHPHPPCEAIIVPGFAAKVKIAASTASSASACRPC